MESNMNENYIFLILYMENWCFNFLLNVMSFRKIIFKINLKVVDIYLDLI